MTNRDKYFTKQNPYDLLIAINNHIDPEECVIRLITGCAEEDLPCFVWAWEECESCKKCLQKWLNAEYRKPQKGIEF